MRDKPTFGNCTISGKVKYDKKGAISAMNQRYKETHVLLRAYVCPDCTCWHLTSRNVLSSNTNNYGNKPKTKKSYIKERRREYLSDRNTGTKYRRNIPSDEEDYIDTYEDGNDCVASECSEWSIESGDKKSIELVGVDRTIIFKTEREINIMISTIAQIVFFGVYAINYFAPFGWAGFLMAIAAAVIALVLIVNSLK